VHEGADVNVPLLIDELARDEGIRLKVYNDSLGIPTIGIGRNLRDRGISKEEAYQLLNHDLESVFADLDQHLPWWRRLDDVRQRVIANMCFNLGINRLMGFEHTLACAMTGRYREAAVSMLDSKWADQVGPRAQRLAEMMRQGLAAEPPPEGAT
jgi:lysozyme